MRYPLDTDTVNYLVKGIALVTARFEDAIQQGGDFVLSPMVHLEVTRYLRLRRSRRMLRFYDSMTARWDWYQFAQDDWDRAADLWAQRARAGRPIEDSDLLIAVSVLASGAVLVTNNGDHFARLGLTTQNWAE